MSAPDFDACTTIVPATDADAATVSELLFAAFVEFESKYTEAAFRATTPPPEEIARRIREGGSSWIAFDVDAPVGTVSAMIRGDEAYIRSMAVLQRARFRHRLEASRACRGICGLQGLHFDGAVDDAVPDGCDPAVRECRVRASGRRASGSVRNAIVRDAKETVAEDCRFDARCHREGARGARPPAAACRALRSPLQCFPMSDTAGEIAIVDDEEALRETVAFALRREGYRVTPFRDGAEAWEAFQQKLPDLVILDVLMPRMDGRELCRRLRAKSETLPIIFLTSRDEELDRVLGLELGADDYLCKPFSVRELAARVKVLFRRAALARRPPSESDQPPVRVGPLELDLQRYIVRWNGSPVDLTVTEFRMLHALVRHPGHVKSRRQLTTEGYPHDAYVSDRTIDSHIKRLRRKFEEIDPKFDRIETVYGVGYRYNGD